MKFWAIIFAGIVSFGALLYYLRPPGEPLPTGLAGTKVLPNDQFINAGKFPGVTWSDDIHPIFVKNKCGDCHTRGKEETVEGLVEYAMGIIDPENSDNPYYSFHELVYAEGPPHKLEGETLRAGQCCWPRNFPVEQQRRIWIGRPERSAIVRKLDRDYYNWNTPPRFLEEGLRLSWGMPMPLFEIEEHHPPMSAEKHAHDEVAQEKANEHDEVEAISHDYDVRSPLEQVIFHFRIWFGGAKDKLRSLPKKISIKDRFLLRYWIEHTIQLDKEGTGVVVKIVDDSGSPVPDIPLGFVGNFNFYERDQVTDIIKMKTDANGYAILSFPRNAVVSIFWHLAAENEVDFSDFKAVMIQPGEMVQVELEI